MISTLTNYAKRWLPNYLSGKMGLPQGCVLLHKSSFQWHFRGVVFRSLYNRLDNSYTISSGVNVDVVSVGSSDYLINNNILSGAHSTVIYFKVHGTTFISRTKLVRLQLDISVEGKTNLLVTQSTIYDSLLNFSVHTSYITQKVRAWYKA